MNDFEFDDLIKSLECYMDRDDEAFCLSKFLDKNSAFLFAPDNLLSDKYCFKFWDMLFEMLLQAEHEITRTASGIVAFLKINFSNQNKSGKKAMSRKDSTVK